MSGNNTSCRPPAAPSGKRARAWALLALLCRYVLAAVFLMAAVTKVTDLHVFEDRVRLHVRLPEFILVLVVRTLPWLELTCGMCLALGWAVREAGLLTALMLLGFLGHSLTASADSDCGCFLFPQPLSTGWAGWPPLRNGVLLLCGLCVVLTRIPPSRSSIS